MSGFSARRLLPFLALAAACGGEEPTPVRVPAELRLLSGDAQQGAAGSVLPAPIVFVVSDRQGPLAGIAVHFSLSDSRGLLSRSADTTGADGSVSLRWTVGGTLGEQTLTARVEGVTPAIARATVSVGPVAIMSPTSPVSQIVVAGHAVAAPPAVRVTDAYANPVPGAAIRFVDPTGASELEGDVQSSDAAGGATLGSWRVPRLAGVFQVRAVASATGTATSFTAYSAPAATRSVAGDGQTANAGTAVDVPPAVLAVDDAGAPLASVRVTFSVQAGGGRLLGSGTVETGATGIAEAPTWVLGSSPGENRVAAEILGTAPITFTAAGVAAIPTQAIPNAPVQQAGFFLNFPARIPSVRLTDAGGRPVAGADVSFVLTSGGGSLARSTAVSDYRGEAALGGWRLGPDPSQSVEARVAGLPPVVFTATASPPPPTAFHIEVRFLGPPPTPSQQDAFTSAAQRWESLILGDLEDVPFSGNLDFCGGQALNETIDDLLIFATVEPIDGPGGVLGAAGWCWARDDNILPFIGEMRFDSDDVAALQAAGQFQTVVLHEMGHVLGVGSVWTFQDLLAGQGGVDPFFIGSSARGAFAAADFTNYPGPAVPVENQGGQGTRDSHWRELILGPELMTGFLDDGPNPLSAVTASSLRDQGYVVNDALSDPYSIAAALRSLSAGPPRPLTEAPWTGIRRTMDRAGRVRRVFFPPLR